MELFGINFKKETVSCPKCNNSSEEKVCNTLSAVIGKSTQKVLNNELNFVICKKCKTVFQIKTDLIYNNFDKHFSVYYHPDNFDEIEKKIPLFKAVYGANSFLATPYKFTSWSRFQNKIKELEGIQNSEVNSLKILRKERGDLFAKDLLEGMFTLFMDIAFSIGLVPDQAIQPKLAQQLINEVYKKLEEIGLKRATEYEKLLEILSIAELENHPATKANEDYVYILNNRPLITEAWNQKYLSGNSSQSIDSGFWTCNVCDGDSSTGCLYFDSAECPKFT